MATEVIVGLFTLAGVALGFAGQWLMETQRTRRTRSGIVKAMLGELRHNAGTFVDIRYAGWDLAPRFSTDTWEAARFELAQFVPDSLFEDLLFIYEDMLPRVGLRLAEASPQGADRWVSDCEERIKRSMKDLLSLPQAASFRGRWDIRLLEEEPPPSVSKGQDQPT